MPRLTEEELYRLAPNYRRRDKVDKEQIRSESMRRVGGEGYRTAEQMAVDSGFSDADHDLAVVRIGDRWMR